MQIASFDGLQWRPSLFGASIAQELLVKRLCGIGIARPSIGSATERTVEIGRNKDQ